MKVIDSRWEGQHGIGRFATEVRRRLPSFKCIELRGQPSAAIDPLRLSRHLRLLAPQLYFSPGYNAPIGAPCPFVFCLHDLNHLFVPENSSALKLAYYRYVIRPAVHRSELVLTVSEFSRNAICSWAEVDGSRVINVGNGVSDAFRPEGRAYRAFDRPYILYVGNHKPHKNLPRLLAAFATCGIPREFLFVGTGLPGAELRRVISQLRLQDRVCFIARPPEQVLAELYRGATSLVLVSTYEGFGLPIIEAMACGTPVVASSIASMPEVAGDAALLVDPGDIEAIGVALKRIIESESLRLQLRDRGLARARQYSWENTVRKISAALAGCE